LREGSWAFLIELIVALLILRCLAISGKNNDGVIGELIPLDGLVRDQTC
jgi:hypothetical protein